MQFENPEGGDIKKRKNKFNIFYMRLILLLIILSSGIQGKTQNDSLKIEIYPNADKLVVGYENRVKLIAPEKYDQTNLSISATGCKVIKNEKENTYLIRVPNTILNKEVEISVMYKTDEGTMSIFSLKVTTIAFDNSVRKIKNQ